MFGIGGSAYVVAGLVFVLALAGAGFEGWHQRDRLAVAEIGAIRSQAEKEVADEKAKAAQVSEKVVIQYRDRIKVVRETVPEVVHDIQVIRDSDCRVPAEFVRVHNDAAGSPPEPAAGTDGTASCAEAIETIRANYQTAREQAEQLKALQDWVSGVAN